MYASGIFIDSFSPSVDESMSIINAIKEFKANLIIVSDQKVLEMRINSWLSENKDFQLANQTQVIHLNTPQEVNMHKADPYTMYQEYFRGKNYDLIQKKDILEKKINDIKVSVDDQAQQYHVQ